MTTRVQAHSPLTGSQPAPAPASIDTYARDADRPAVVDLAYGKSTVGMAPGPDVGGLLHSIDANSIMSEGHSYSCEQMWERAFAAISALADARGPHAPLVVTHPSTWGDVRSGVLARAAARVRPDITFVHRAVLIARSHADITVSRCAVVETTHIPAYPVDPARHRQLVWDVTRLRRRAGDWEIEGGGVLTPTGDDGHDGRAVELLVDDGIAAVYVDGSDDVHDVDEQSGSGSCGDGGSGGQIGHAIALISRHAVAGRVLRVDRRLIERWGVSGWRPGTTTTVDWIEPEPRTSARRRVVLACAVALTLIIVSVAVTVGVRQRDASPVRGDAVAVVGRSTLLVPAEWTRSDPPAPSASADSQQTRTVFADPADGDRVLLVQSPVRAGASQASVAVSLRNRILQRGDDVVSEFSAATRFGGREVISYRESPESGGAIRWYVIVAHELQVSVGCQAGTGGDSIEQACAVAVNSLRIGPK